MAIKKKSTIKKSSPVKKGSGARAKKKAAATKSKRAAKNYQIPERLETAAERKQRLSSKVVKPGKKLPFKTPAKRKTSPVKRKTTSKRK